MHPNPAFRRVGEARIRALAEARGFGLISVNGPDGPLISHAPFVLDTDAAEAHLTRSNPVLRLLGDAGAPAVLAVSGPDGYVSPDWYGAPDQVPTWNYVAAHLRGTLRRLPDDALDDHLNRLSAAQESRLAPKPPWTMDKMTPDIRARMMRAIVPVRLEITGMDGTWKLNQNKPDAQRLSAADHIAQSDAGRDTAALARLMRDPPEG